MLSFEFDRSNMIEPILKADPSFREKWQAFLDDFEGHDELPLHLALSELARHLIQNLETGHTHRFNAVFEVVEHWHINGDDYVKEAATVGLLEGLQNETLHHRTRPEDFVPCLRPESLRWWAKLNEFWAAGKPMI